MPDIDQLIEAFFSGELDSQGAAELRAWIDEDKSRMEVFVSRSRSEVALQRVYEMRRIQGIRTSFLFNELLEDAEHHDVDPVDITHIVESARAEIEAHRRSRLPAADQVQAPRGPRVIVIPRIMAYGGLAAAAIAVAGLVWTMLGDKPEPAPATGLAPTTPKTEAIDRTVASVIDQAGSEDGVSLIGQTLSAGESLAIRSGMVKLQTPQGASLVIEGPARLVAMGAGRVRLEEGRIVARCEPAGSQIAIDAGDLRVIDLGTEFAVVRMPGQPVSVHVFDGEVAASTPDATGNSEHQQHVTVGQAVSYDAGTGAFVPEPVGWSNFVRDFRSDSKPLETPAYVLAYWRFEDNAPGGFATPGGFADGSPAAAQHSPGPDQPAVSDSSGQGNHLYTAPANARTRFSGAVAERTVPVTGQMNAVMLDDSGPGEPGVIRNLHTRSAVSTPRHPLDTYRFEQWTVEFSVCFEKLEGVQSLVSFTTDHYERVVLRLGADGDRLYAGAENRMGRWDELHVDAMRLQAGRWYHVAVTNDGQTMRIWLCEQGGRSYQTVASMPVDGVFIHQTLPTNLPEWTLGGEGDKCDAFCLLDEVRVSAQALSPDQMLYARAAAKQMGVQP